jgi:hypothetical protein
LKPIFVPGKMNFNFFESEVNFIIDLMYNVIGFFAVILYFVGYGIHCLIFLRITGIIG